MDRLFWELDVIRQNVWLSVSFAMRTQLFHDSLMLGSGIMTACEALRANGTLVVFDTILDDSDFGIVANPIAER
jgi:hypothetical protein